MKMPRGLLVNSHAVSPGFMLLIMVFIGLIMSSMVVFFCASEKKKKKRRSEANLRYANGGEQKKSGDRNRDVWISEAANVMAVAAKTPQPPKKTEKKKKKRSSEANLGYANGGEQKKSGDGIRDVCISEAANVMAIAATTLQPPKKTGKKKKKRRSEANLGYVNGGEQKKSGDGNRDVWILEGANVMAVAATTPQPPKKTEKKKKRSEANLGYANGGEQKKSGDGNRDVWFAGRLVAAMAITLAASQIGDNTNCGGCGSGGGGCGGGGCGGGGGGGGCGGGGCGGGGCGGGCGG